MPAAARSKLCSSVSPARRIEHLPNFDGKKIIKIEIVQSNIHNLLDMILQGKKRGDLVYLISTGYNTNIHTHTHIHTHIHTYPQTKNKTRLNIPRDLREFVRLNWCLFGFYGISTLVGYLMPNHVYVYIYIYIYIYVYYNSVGCHSITLWFSDNQVSNQVQYNMESAQYLG